LTIALLSSATISTGTISVIFTASPLDEHAASGL
jgi:hypothetical protein